MTQAPTPGPLSGDDELIERGLRTIRTYDAVRSLRDALSATTSRLASYDWNADPDAITKQQGDAFAAADKVFFDLDAAVAAQPDIDLPECEACNGTGKIEEAARTEGANQHSACVRSCDECDGCGFAPDPSLAPTAPVEASGSDDPLREHVRAMQRMATAYLVPEDYTDRNGDVTFHGTDTNSREYKYDQAGRRAKAFANDMIYMLDGPEERAAMSALRPQPSGETREAVAAGWFRQSKANPGSGEWYQVEPDEVKDLEHLGYEVRQLFTAPQPAPVALGGQHSSGETETLRVLLDNLVIAQTLSKDLRQKATDEARSYLYELRHAAPVAETAGEAVGVVSGCARADLYTADLPAGTLLYAAPVPAQDDDKLRESE